MLGRMESVIATCRLSVRNYVEGDRTACLALFDSNAPDFFAPDERDDYVRFLDHLSCAYLVICSPLDGIIAAGGYYVTDQPGLGALAWGLVARTWHRRGVGHELLQLRLSHLRESRVRAVRVRTSQLSRSLFEHSGFRLVRLVPHGFAPNIDLVELSLELRTA